MTTKTVAKGGNDRTPNEIPQNKPATGRDEAGRLLPGAKLNPGGRPKEDIAFRARARKAVDEFVAQKWIDEVERDGPDWLKASELLAAYAYGKPSQSLEVTPMAQPRRAGTGWPIERLKELATLLLKKEAAALSPTESERLGDLRAQMLVEEALAHDGKL